MDDALLDEKFRARDAALVIAVASMDKRLDGMNEFRDTLRDQASSFVTRHEFTAAHESLGGTVDQMRLELSRYVSRVEENDKSSMLDRGQLDKRLESMNEFRAQLKDQAAAFITRNEQEAVVLRLSETNSRLETRVTAAESRLAMWDGRFWAVGILFVLLNLFVSYFITTHFIN